MARKEMLVPVYDDEWNRIGAETKKVVHEQGRRHCSTILLLCQKDKILCQVRRAETHAGRLDLFGGHEAVADDGSPLRNALREAEEELCLFREGLSLPWDVRVFHLLGHQGILVSEAPENRERTSVFGVRLEDDVVVSAGDELDSGLAVAVEVVPLSLKFLEECLLRYPRILADGLNRLLRQMAADLLFREQVVDLVAGSPGKGQWKINFACTRPGEPGCGCPDNDFFASHDFFGTYEEAEAEARRLSWERYRGDFQHWIE